MSKQQSATLGILTGAFLIGLAGIAYATDNGVGDNTCPQWTTLKCTHWSLGPPPVCTATACVADKKSDPVKTLGTSTVGGKRPKFPIATTIGTGLKLRDNSTLGSLSTKACVGPKKCP